MTENNYYVRPIAGLWQVSWNDSAEVIASCPSQHEAKAVAEMLARHMLEQGRGALVQVFEPEVRTPSWGRNRAAAQPAFV
jgi:hypothetical protein